MSGSVESAGRGGSPFLLMMLLTVAILIFVVVVARKQKGKGTTSKKSLICGVAGVLLIMAAALAFFKRALAFSSTMYPYFEKAELSLKMFKRDGFFQYFLNMGMDFWAWAEIILLALAGILLIVKGVIPNLVPSIALGGIFGLLALLTVVPTFRNFIAMFAIGNFKGFLCYAVWTLADFLKLLTFASMAAIILLKSSLGGLFFIPAGVAAVNAFLEFLINLTGMFNMFGASHIFIPVNDKPMIITWTFGASLVFLLINCVLIAALFAAGMANNEE